MGYIYICITQKTYYSWNIFGFSDPSQRVGVGGDDDEEEKKEDVKFGDNEELLKMADKLSVNIMRNGYNRVFKGFHPLFYKRMCLVLTTFGCDNPNDECWWIKNYGNKENILIISLIDSIDCLQFWSKTDDRSKWKWGLLHEVEIFHPVSAKLGPKPFNSDVHPLRGSYHTLCMCRPNCEGIVENPLKVIRASVPTWRQNIDLSDWNKSRCILTMGTSGQCASPYYQNQLKLFVDCEYIPMLWIKK